MIKAFNGKMPRIAESALVSEAACIVGVPGRIKGRVSLEQSFWVEDASKSYARIVKLYKEQGGL